MPKIFLYCYPAQGANDVIGYALAEDGAGLASHLSSNKYIKLAEKYMDEVARHYDPVPQEGAIIDFACWLDRAVEQRDEAIGELAGESNNMELCGNCGTPRFIHGAILEGCQKCGDDETDLAMREELP